MSEQDYINGTRTAYRNILTIVSRELGGPEMDAAEAIAELDATRAALRKLSERLGCDDWPDNLYLADVVENHIGRCEALEGIE
jgi:hypothetical protein